MKKCLEKLGFELDSTEGVDYWNKNFKNEISVSVSLGRIKVFEDFTNEILNEKYNIETLKSIINNLK